MSVRLIVNLLLQRLEDFAGPAILTTNLNGAMDSAFPRRLQFFFGGRA